MDKTPSRHLMSFDIFLFFNYIILSSDEQEMMNSRARMLTTASAYPTSHGVGGTCRHTAGMRRSAHIGVGVSHAALFGMKTMMHGQRELSSVVVCRNASGSATTPSTPSGRIELPYRIGHGWDLHRLEPGYPLIIGGIDIPHERGCVAHSDGDVLLHTVVDAILGALCLPDIGQLFPDTDPTWKGCRSDVFLREAVRLMKERGYELGNIDCTIIAQKPKLSPHKEAIRENLCAILGADPSVVNIKAKTHEKVDSLGENRSIACEAVVLLLLSS